MDKINIYAWPAYATKKLNPYNYILYKHIAERGYIVHDFYSEGKSQFLKLLTSKEVKILHIHWPTSNVMRAKNSLHAVYRLLVFFIFIKGLKIVGKKLLWTVHNIEEHENFHPILQQLMNRILYNNVDGFISLNRNGVNIIKEKIKAGANQKISYIRHPHYKDYYSNYITREDARAKLGINENTFVFLFLGQVRQYKNVESLIKAFKDLNRKNTVLIVAGKFHRDVSASAIEELTREHNNIKVVNSFIEEQDLQIYYNSTDLVVNPFNKIFNSGSVFLNLSFGKPTLAPDMCAITELKESLGSRWIKTYKGELTAKIMLKTMIRVIEEQGDTERTEPQIDRFDPDAVAKQTIEFYKCFLT